jgi:hypothetical protein
VNVLEDLVVGFFQLRFTYTTNATLTTAPDFEIAKGIGLEIFK